MFTGGYGVQQQQADKNLQELSHLLTKLKDNFTITAPANIFKMPIYQLCKDGPTQITKENQTNMARVPGADHHKIWNACHQLNPNQL